MRWPGLPSRHSPPPVGTGSPPAGRRRTRAGCRPARRPAGAAPPGVRSNHRPARAPVPYRSSTTSTTTPPVAQRGGAVRVPGTEPRAAGRPDRRRPGRTGGAEAAARSTAARRPGVTARRPAAWRGGNAPARRGRTGSGPRAVADDTATEIRGTSSCRSGRVQGVTGHTTPDRAALRGWLPGFLALAVIWGASFLFIKVGVSELHPLYVTLGRVSTGAVDAPGRAAPHSVTGSPRPGSGRTWRWSARSARRSRSPCSLRRAAGVVDARRHLERHHAAGRAAARGVALPHRADDLAPAVGLGLGFVGVLVILGVWQGVGGAALTGQLMCLGAATCYGVAIPYYKRFVAAAPSPGVAISTMQLITGGRRAAVISPLVAGAPPAPTSLSRRRGRDRPRARRARHRPGVRDQHPQHPAGRREHRLDRHLRDPGGRGADRRVRARRAAGVVPAGRRAVVLLGVAVAQGLLGPRRPRRTSVAADGSVAELPVVADASVAAPPAAGDTPVAAPPADGSVAAPPADGLVAAPPADGSVAAPPADGSVAAPPADGDTPVATTPVGVGASVTARPAGADAAAVPEPEATVC